MKIWIVKDGERLGPYTEEEVTRRLSGGEIAATDLAWVQGMAAWAPLSQVLSGGPSVPVPLVVPAAPPPPVYAGFWLRFVALLLDWLVLLVPALCVGSTFGLLCWMNGGMDRHAARGLGNTLWIVMVWLYFSLMESSPLQGTLGKLALGIKVTDMEGRRISFGRATGRYFGKFVSAIIFCIGFMMAGFTARKQALHDMMAGCLVVRR